MASHSQPPSVGLFHTKPGSHTSCHLPDEKLWVPLARLRQLGIQPKPSTEGLHGGFVSPLPSPHRRC